MNTLVFNPIVMASAAASVLGAMMCLSLYVVKCAIDKRDAMHEQQYDALYDKCTKLKQKVNTMAKEMSLMRLDDGIIWSDTTIYLASIGIYPSEMTNYPAAAIRSLKSSVERLKQQSTEKDTPVDLPNPNAIHLLEANEWRSKNPLSINMKPIFE